MLEVGWWGVIKGSFQKQGVGKGKSCSKGVLKVSPLLPPPPLTENFNHTQPETVLFSSLGHKNILPEGIKNYVLVFVASFEINLWYMNATNLQ